MTGIFAKYDRDAFFDEMFSEDGEVRPSYQAFFNRLSGMSPKEIMQRQHLADKSFLDSGITFQVYKDGQGVDKIFPFDVIPRVIPAEEWDSVERGLKQRIRALNLFLDDLYNDQKILKDGIIPREVIETSPNFLEQCRGLKPPKGIWIHVTGTDLIRHSDGEYYVLEDNLRVPSGVAYVLGNREIMKRTFPQVFDATGVRPIYDYPLHLHAMLEHISPVDRPTVGVLTPGIFNSAYYEHSFLSQQMGVQLVEGRDLGVVDGAVCMRTTKGYQRIDVLYRRIDDSFLDPQAFRPDSALGVPGLMEAYRNGKIALANAPGTGVADDKVVYAYVPEIIRYYLSEDPIIKNVPTYLCWREEDRAHVLANMAELVVKPANEAGGYGVMIGPKTTAKERAECKAQILENPREFIAQPVMSLSRVPTLIKNSCEGRHVDLRPFIIYGEEIRVMPGGLSRVALKRGSLVVNSSQGGGSKDTWVLRN